MASQRLTKPIRDTILKNLIERSFGPRAQGLVDRTAKLALDVYDYGMGDRLALLESLPRGWVPRQRYIKVVFGSEHTELNFCGSIGSWFNFPGGEIAQKAHLPRHSRDSDRSTMPVPDDRHRVKFCVVPEDHALSAEYWALNRDLDDLGEDLKRARVSGEAVLSSVTTLNKLIEVWPEAQEFVKPYLSGGEARAVLPAVRREELNAIFDLPPGEAEVAGGTVA